MLVWDERKRQLNIAKHGLDFADAAEVFTNGTLRAATANTREKKHTTKGKTDWARVDAMKVIPVRAARSQKISDEGMLLGAVQGRSRP